MAKKGGKPSYTSKGQRPSVKPSLANATRADLPKVDAALNIIKAYNEGRNPWVTIDNPNTKETAKRKIRIKANSLWGQPKDRKPYCVPGTGDPADKKKKKVAAE